MLPSNYGDGIAGSTAGLRTGETTSDTVIWGEMGGALPIMGSLAFQSPPSTAAWVRTPAFLPTASCQVPAHGWTRHAELSQESVLSVGIVKGSPIGRHLLHGRRFPALPGGDPRQEATRHGRNERYTFQGHVHIISAVKIKPKLHAYCIARGIPSPMYTLALWGRGGARCTDRPFSGSHGFLLHYRLSSTHYLYPKHHSGHPPQTQDPS